MSYTLMSIRTWIWNATLRRPASVFLSIVGICVIWFILLRIQQQAALLQEEDFDWEKEYERLRIASLKEHASFYVGDKNAMSRQLLLAVRVLFRVSQLSVQKMYVVHEKYLIQSLMHKP